MCFGRSLCNVISSGCGYILLQHGGQHSAPNRGAVHQQSRTEHPADVVDEGCFVGPIYLSVGLLHIKSLYFPEHQCVEGQWTTSEPQQKNTYQLHKTSIIKGSICCGVLFYF